MTPSPQAGVPCSGAAVTRDSAIVKADSALCQRRFAGGPTGYPGPTLPCTAAAGVVPRVESNWEYPWENFDRWVQTLLGLSVTSCGWEYPLPGKWGYGRSLGCGHCCGHLHRQ